MFKTILVISVCLMVLVGCSGQFKEKFNFAPAQPQVGQEIVVRYNPAGTELAEAQQVEMLAYQFSTEETKVIDVAMQKKGKGWQGSLVPDSATLLIMVQFQSDDVTDNNEKQGYKIMLYGSDGRYLPGSLAQLANIYLWGGYPMRLERNPDSALVALNQEFELYPEQKGKNRELYWNILLRKDKTGAKNQIIATLDSLAAKRDLSLDEQKLLANWYERIDLVEKAELYKKEIRKAEPKGDLVQSERFDEFYQAKDLADKIKLAKQFSSDFPASEQLSSVSSVLINTLINAGQYDEAQAYLEQEIASPKSYFYNSLAWTMVEKAINLKTAVAMAQKGIELARKELETPISEKPPYLTETQWRNNQKYSLGSVLDTYAFTLYQLGQVAESISPYEEAVQLHNKTNTEVNERYARALVDHKDNEKALQFLQERMQQGQSTAGMQDLFNQAYVAINGSDRGLDSVLAVLNTAALAKIQKELQKEMIDIPAPQFSLVDLAGNTIALKDLQGKTLVLDFWATWCGPCIKSFPAMQQAVKKYATDDNVKFLFINTWERGEGIEQKVADFIEKNNYTFHVLMDTANQVVADYKVEGIPTKFIVDKTGKIRFKSVGFGGSDDKLVAELSMMIDMIK